MIKDIVLITSIFHFRGVAGSLDDLKGFGSDLDFSCGRTNGRTNKGVPRGPRGPKNKSFVELCETVINYMENVGKP